MFHSKSPIRNFKILTSELKERTIRSRFGEIRLFPLFARVRFIHTQKKKERKEDSVLPKMDYVLYEHNDEMLLIYIGYMWKVLINVLTNISVKISFNRSSFQQCQQRWASA